MPSSALLSVSRKTRKSEAEKRYRDEFVQDILLKNVRFEKGGLEPGQALQLGSQRTPDSRHIDIDNYKHQFGIAQQIDDVSNLEEIKKRITISLSLW